MSLRITLSIGGHELPGILNDSETSVALGKRLPLDVKMSRWGEEYYGGLDDSLGVSMAPDARTEMAIGALAYWLPGNALCIFFGPTPASEGDEPRAASEANPVGQLSGDMSVLGQLGQSVAVRVEAVE